MFLFYAIHYPLSEKEALLIQNMHEFGELIKKQPGIIFVNPYPFRDTEKGTLLGISIWESQEAFQAAALALENDFPSEEWEVKPREVYMLNSAV